MLIWKVVQYVDSDYASKGTAGDLSPAGPCSVLMLVCPFFSRAQKSATLLSSMGVNFVAMAEGISEACFFGYIWSFIFPDIDAGGVHYGSGGRRRGKSFDKQPNNYQKTRRTSTCVTTSFGSAWPRGRFEVFHVRRRISIHTGSSPSRCTRTHFTSTGVLRRTSTDMSLVAFNAFTSSCQPAIVEFWAFDAAAAASVLRGFIVGFSAYFLSIFRRNCL